MLGLGVLIFGCLFAWIGSFMTYGFGQLIESTQNIENKICPQESNASRLMSEASPVQSPSPAVNSNVKWRCPKCHTPYTNEVKRCDVCGEINPGYQK